MKPQRKIQTTSRRQHGSVKLREKRLRNGDRSLYLDTYHEGKRKYDFLGIYLTGSHEDRELLRQAETIRAKRELELLSRRSGIIPEHRRDESFVGFARSIAEGKRHVYWQSLVERIREYDSSATMASVTAEWCRGFIDHLRTPPTGKKGMAARTLGSGMVRREFLNFRHIVREAIRRGAVDASVLDRIRAPKAEDVEHTWLTVDELRSLAALTDMPTPGTIETRRAFLFACYSGLRISDVRRLTWGMVTREGATFRQKKTANLQRLPLSRQARAIIGERPAGSADTDAIFDHLPTLQSINSALKTMAKRAGIAKRLHFHASRHTFAVNYLSHGGDLFCLMKLLGHSEIASTQIYADIVEARLHEGVELIPGLDLGG